MTAEPDFEHLPVVERVERALGRVHDNLIIFSHHDGTSISTGDVKEMVALLRGQGPVADESAPLTKADEAAVFSTWLTLAHHWKHGDRDDAFAHERLRWLYRKARAIYLPRHDGPVSLNRN